MKIANHPMVVLALLLFAFTAPACATCPPCASMSSIPCPTCEDCTATAIDKPKGPRIWRVTKVKDGDALVVKQEDPERIETVRLLRVNKPEKNERGFEEAKEALKCLVRGAEVTPCGGHRISRNLLTQSRARELLTKISPSLGGNCTLPKTFDRPGFSRLGSLAPD